MTAAAPYTPSVVNTIRRNAGVVPPQKIAADLGWSGTRLKRTAEKHGIDLHAQIVRRDDGALVLATLKRASLGERRSEHFGVRLRPAAAKIILEKAAARYVDPCVFLAEIIEGATALGKIDDMASAARNYRPGSTDSA